MEELDIAALDAAYRAAPFPAVEDWAHFESHPDVERAINAWLESRKRADEIVVAKALRVQTRAAAWDSGAIERLYDTDPGVTLSIAEEGAAWQAVMKAAGDDAQALFDAQMTGFDMAFDIATGETELSASWLRQLHATITAPQADHVVQTAAGPQRRRLRHGEYKVDPNHVLQPDGTAFPYCPVEDVAAEVQRLVDDARSRTRHDLPVAVQAAWLHYAFVRIHPFADGNGRVARALASIPIWRAASFPLSVVDVHRPAYLGALRDADGGDASALIRFVDSTILATADDLRRRLKTHQQRTAIRKAVESQAARPGLTHAQLHAAARNLMPMLDEIVSELQAAGGLPDEYRFSLSSGLTHALAPPSGWKLPVDPGLNFELRMSREWRSRDYTTRSYQIFVRDRPSTLSDLRIGREDGREHVDLDVEAVHSSDERLSTFLLSEILEMASELTEADTQ